MSVPSIIPTISAKPLLMALTLKKCFVSITASDFNRTILPGLISFDSIFINFLVPYKSNKNRLSSQISDKFFSGIKFLRGDNFFSKILTKIFARTINH